MRKNRILALLVLMLCMISSVQAQEIPQNYKGKTRVTMGAFGTVSSLCIFDDLIHLKSHLFFRLKFYADNIDAKHQI